MMNDNYDWYQKSKYDCRLSGRWRVVILVIEQLSRKERGDDDDYEDDDRENYDDDDRDESDQECDDHDEDHYQAK